eukprot:gene13756-4679_t
MDTFPSDFVQILPPEVTEMIFANLAADEIYSSLLTSKKWLNFIDNDSVIWKRLCQHFDEEDIQEDLAKGLTWKNVFLNNFGVKGCIRSWIKGRFSNFETFDELACRNVITVIDVETWGIILEAELKRN